MRKRVFAVVVGSGFSGSLVSWILQRHGKDAVVIDRGKHPRFAIGESSTPTADFLLAHLADRWDLPELAPLACWGTWKEAYPEIRCGKKRGFSYFQHETNKIFSDDSEHHHSLLVAASSEDRWSDTQWMRSDVDHFLYQSAANAGVKTFENSEIIAAEWQPSQLRWRIDIRNSQGEIVPFESDFLIDASGGGKAIAPFVGQKDLSSSMRTKTGSLYAHFQGVPDFMPLHYSPECRANDPFQGDDAAQHHVFETGWMWMIRFDDGTTSVGLVQPEHEWGSLQTSSGNLQAHWDAIIGRYPSMQESLSGAKCIAPSGGIRFHRCLSRKLDRGAGQGWFSLPTAFGFVDPLHSSGIAHALSGVVRICDILLSENGNCSARQLKYSRQLIDEVDWIDTLVAGCYRGLPSFERFTGYAAFYFLAAIGFEKQMASDPSHWPLGFLQCDDQGLRETAEEYYLNKQRTDVESNWLELLRRSISPWNKVGLLEPSLRNRLSHTTAPKYASIASRGR